MSWKNAWRKTVSVLRHLDKPAKVALVIPGLQLYSVIALAVDKLFDAEWTRLQKEKAKEKVEKAKK